MPDFTDAIQSIMAEHAHKFSHNDEEQDLEWYSIFKNYVKTIESLLKDFLDDHKITETELHDWWQRISEYNTDALACLDYLVATSEYSEFVEMMVEYKEANDWEVKDQEDDFLSSILNMKMEPPQKRDE